MKNLNNWKFVIIALVAGLFLGWLFFHNTPAPGTELVEDHAHDPNTEYTCSMHPQIRQSEQGQCPICGMELIPVDTGSDDGGDPASLTMSESAIKLASIQTTKVSRNIAIGELKLSGKIAVDERRIFHQTAHFPGRIEKLFVKVKGEYVRAGQKIASIYSPELIIAQKELLEAYRYRESNEVLWVAARNKLKLWKLSDSFIEEVIAANEIKTEINILAENSGIVLELKVGEGDHLMEGGSLFSLANLANLWVLFDAYESDLPMISVGNQVHFSVPSLPGGHFHGKVTFIDPVINPATRTVSVRAEVTNGKGQLKPDMFADGLIVVRTKSKNELLVPRSAVLWTGSRSVVYVQNPESENPSFRMRQIEIGPMSNGYYPVIAGLAEGEEVVTNGVFSVDAAAQLQGKPSMMNSEGGKQSLGGHAGMDMGGDKSVDSGTKDELEDIETDPEFQKQLGEVYIKYLVLKDALIRSDSEAASLAAGVVMENLKAVDMALVKGDDQMIKWMRNLKTMQEASEKIENARTIEDQRPALASLTSGLVESIKLFGLEGEKVYYLYCPMAFDNKGDFWLSNSETVENPYFGEMMLSCGEVVETINFNK